MQPGLAGDMAMGHTIMQYNWPDCKELFYQFLNTGFGVQPGQYPAQHDQEQHRFEDGSSRCSVPGVDGGVDQLFRWRWMSVGWEPATMLGQSIVGAGKWVQGRIYSFQ